MNEIIIIALLLICPRYFKGGQATETMYNL